MDRSRLAAVIPAHNEQATIGEVVAEACRHALVIVVDDCSSDGTGRIAAQAGAHVITNAHNLGYDGTIKAGFVEAWRLGAEAVVTLDADGEHDPRVLEHFRRLLIDDRVPMVVGRRASPARLAEYVFVWAMRGWLGIDDVLCGCKGYRREAYDANGGFDHVGAIGTELAAATAARGFDFRQIDVPGRTRADQPRFGRHLRANLKLLAGLARLVIYIFPIWRRPK